MNREFRHYQQSGDILRRMCEVPLIAVVGPTRAGKTTLMEYARAQDPSLHFVVSDVSRSPRPNEIEGVHYYFRTRQTMEARVRTGLYATVAPSITGDLYATSPDEYDQFGQPIMAVISSAIPAFRQVFPAMRTVVVLPPSLEVWVDRSEERDKQAKRMAEAVESLTFAATDEQSLYVINNGLAAAQTAFMHMLQGGSVIDKVENQLQGQRLAAELLQRIKTS